MINVQVFTASKTLSTALSHIAHNVRAAWRSGGFHYHLCGLLPFNFALPFPRGYCRRCAKPPVGCQCIVRNYYENVRSFRLFQSLYAFGAVSHIIY